MPVKWIDNLLAAHDLPGIRRESRGVQRRVSDEGMLTLEIIRLLTHELGMPLRTAAPLAVDAVRQHDDGWARAVVASGVTLLFPVRAIQERLRRRTLDVLEEEVPVRRGRPRSSNSRKTKTPDQ